MERLYRLIEPLMKYPLANQSAPIATLRRLPMSMQPFIFLLADWWFLVNRPARMLCLEGLKTLGLFYRLRDGNTIYRLIEPLMKYPLANQSASIATLRRFLFSMQPQPLLAGGATGASTHDTYFIPWKLFLPIRRRDFYFFFTTWYVRIRGMSHYCTYILET